jgi:hypothetical protein
MDLGKIPTELYLEIFFALESLKVVVSLASTSRQLRAIWIEHADVIYRAVAPKSIEGEKHARILQLSISGNTKITSKDASEILHHANFTESIIHQFTEKLVKRAPCELFPNKLRKVYLPLMQSQHSTCSGPIIRNTEADTQNI